MTRVLRFLSAVLLVLLAPHAGRARQPGPGERPTIDEAKASAAIEAAVQKEIDAKLFPGAVVAIGDAEGILYLGALGFAQVEPKRVAMRKDSIFDVASVTKVVCAATAVGIYKDRGLLDPDAPMTRYLPDHQGRGVDRITLRKLASHTSGFPENPRVSRAGTIKGDAIFRRMLQDEPAWPVDAQYQYACRNIIYLSTIVERVSGRGFGEFCANEIFEPLGMVDSRFNRVEPSERVVATHHPVLGECHNPDAIAADRAIGNVGLFTTATDLARFGRMMAADGVWRGKRILSAATVADFTRTHQLPQFPAHGFIWETEKASLHRPTRMSEAAYGHSGYTGVSIWIDPKSKVYTIVLTSRNHPRLDTKSGVEPKNTPRGIQQYKARGRIADAMLEAFEY